MTKSLLAVLNIELATVRTLRHAEDHDLRIAAAQREIELEQQIAAATPHAPQQDQPRPRA